MEGLQRQDDAELASSDDPTLRCTGCDASITSSDHVFRMTSGPAVFSNPAGFVYDVLTVREAWGLTAHGRPTAEFTWFPGYAWSIVTCASCRTHLGWRFEGSADPAVFYGLLRDRLH